MKDDSKSIKNQNSEFLEKYLAISNHLIKELSTLGSSEKLQKIIYLITQKKLIARFSINVNKNNFFKRNSIRKNETLKSKLSNEIEKIIEQEIINLFQYSEEMFQNDITNNFVTPEILSLIYENSRDMAFKQEKGIFYTNKIEVEFMCKESITQFLAQNCFLPIEKLVSFVWNSSEVNHELTIDEKEIVLDILSTIKILDPACGSGQFLIGISSLLIDLFTRLNEINKKRKINIDEFLMNNLYGFDIDDESLNICNIRMYLLLASEDKEKDLNFNLFKKDPLIENKDDVEKEREKFDIIISNPPFVRQELIFSKEYFHSKDLDYKRRVIANINEIYKKKYNIKHYLKSDFYIYFFYMALSMLKQNGVLCFITSNSWLDSKFGFYFKEFLLENYQLLRIYCNFSERAFLAAVNTVITLITNSLNETVLKNNQVSFISIRERYNKVLNVQNIINFYKLQRSIIEKNYRKIVVSQEQLRKANLMNNRFSGERWNAEYFRAPDIYEILINKITNKLQPLHQLGKVRYPIKTGINDFFIIDKKTIKKYNIESEFLVPILKSPKKMNHFLVKAENLENRLFLCNFSKKQLQNKNKIGALNYIKWGETQKTEFKQQTSKSIFWSDVQSVSNNKPDWYSLNLLDFSQIFCNRFFDRRFFFCYTNDKIIEDQTFYGILLKEEFKANKDLIVALLNSSLSYFFLEIFGRTSLGKGALQYSVYDMSLHQIPNFQLIPKEIQKELLIKFEPLKKRQFSSIYNEIKRKDRLTFDKVIFDWLGLSENEIRQIYESFLFLVNERIKKSTTITDIS